MIRSLRCTCFQLSLQLSNPEQKTCTCTLRVKKHECASMCLQYFDTFETVDKSILDCIAAFSSDLIQMFPSLPNPPSLHLTCETLHLQGSITTLSRWNTLTQNTQSSHRIKHGSKKSLYSSVTVSNKLVITAPGLSPRGPSQNIAQMLPTPAIACERVVGKGSVGSEIISAGK